MRINIIIICLGYFLLSCSAPPAEERPMRLTYEDSINLTKDTIIRREIPWQEDMFLSKYIEHNARINFDTIQHKFKYINPDSIIYHEGDERPDSNYIRVKEQDRTALQLSMAYHQFDDKPYYFFTYSDGTDYGYYHTYKQFSNGTSLIAFLQCCGDAAVWIYLMTYSAEGKLTDSDSFILSHGDAGFWGESDLIFNADDSFILTEKSGFYGDTGQIMICDIYKHVYHIDSTGCITEQELKITTSVDESCKEWSRYGRKQEH